MPFVPVPNTAEIELVYDLDGQIVENTLYYVRETPAGLEDLTALVAEVRAFIVSQLIPLLANTIDLIRVVGRLIDVADGFVVTDVTGLPATGGQSSAAAPNNVALTVSFRTGHAGRSFRGRNFIPGIPKNLVTENTVNPTLVGQYVTAYEGLRTLSVDGGWTQAVVSRFSGFTIVDGKKVPTPRTTGIATPMTSVLVVDSTVDSQRRRLPGRGR